MKLEIGNYVITSDERQFIVNVKMTKGEGERVKTENVGKDYLKPIGYFTEFNSALKSIPQKALMQSDDVTDLKELLRQIDEDIKAIPTPVRVEIEKVIVKKVSDKKGYVLIKEDEYENLKEDSDKLYNLECAGVDNWEGYEYAMSMYDEDNYEDYDE